MRPCVLAVPGDRALDPFAQRASALGSRTAPRRGVASSFAARLAVRHRGVPDDLAVEAGQLGDDSAQSRGSTSPRPVPRLTGSAPS